MRSIYAKLVLWAVGVSVLSLVGFIATFSYLEEPHPGRRGFINGLMSLQLEGARRALADGGPDRLAAYLRTLNEDFRVEHHLVDRNGVDLVDGRDRSDDLARASNPPHPPAPRANGGQATKLAIDDGPRLLVLIPRPPRWTTTLPYYLWIIVPVLGLLYALAVHLARPLLSLRRAVDRFGRGELSTRIGSQRRDEIGELARAFDLMAQRIESLMAAERRLIQDVSHELRSPLTRLGLAVRLGRDGGDCQKAMDRIKRETDRLSSLVDELLRLNSAEEDAASRGRDEVPLHDLLRSLVDDCAVEADAKRCRLELRIAAPATILGDLELVRRAVENVLRNAVRHSPADMPVEIDLRSDGSTATITIRDHGPGVPDDALTAVFKPFFRIEGDRSRSSGGVGLGLAIAERAVRLHDGTIAAANAHPGLQVNIRLPVVTDRDSSP
ncbi:sensor histidine kinase [Paludisphaera borealis]|uniref:histidine kinase n=1 Tax=Paludisphaera borealis TaxID=1387353 RepID=A0A1U7CTP5_9BACT|nr:HAMP domain-containing histidine kinase [Paludisphaera borealis]APW62317.1 Sensor protein CpxA [Paludisphaera borealis]